MALILFVIATIGATATWSSYVEIINKDKKMQLSKRKSFLEILVKNSLLAGAVLFFITAISLFIAVIAQIDLLY
jgi:flagellar biosynthesis protein FlhB